jgi:DNA-binding transcriptional regulator YhcF (GntR family)
MVFDRLRDRILVGQYFGCWAPGDRLPSVREVARFEAVDRKTAAAAYRRLAVEGLVRIEPRSGIYLGDHGRGVPEMDPLRRLHVQWLDHALARGAELGLAPDALARMLEAVARLQARPIAVVDQDPEHARFLSRELAVRTGLEFIIASPSEVPAVAGPLSRTPFIVASPIAAPRLSTGKGRIPLVQATLAPDLLHGVSAAARQGAVALVVGTDGLRREVERAMLHGLVEHGDRVTIVLAPPVGSDGEAGTAIAEASTTILWPGAAPLPAWSEGGRVVDMQGEALLSAATLVGIRWQLARTALDRLSSSSGA